MFDRGISLHPGAAVLLRVIAWWAEDPSRTNRDEMIEVLLDSDPRRGRDGGSK